MKTSYEDLIRDIISLWRRRLPPRDLIRRDKGFALKDIFERPRKIVTIIGPRRAGKTYFTFQLYSEIAESGEPCVYMNFEDERIPSGKEVLSDFLTVVESELGGSGCIIMDEVQRMEEWSRWLRRVYDTADYSIVVTGSSSKLTGYEIPRELAERTISIRILPLRFQEFLKFKGERVDFSGARFSEEKKAKLIGLLKEYLTYGGLPEVVLADEFKKLSLLQDYYRTVMVRDIAKGRVRNLSLLDSFLKLLARAKYFSISKTYNSLRGVGYRVGKTTLCDYLSYAQEVFFVFLVSPFGAKAPAQMPKKSTSAILDISQL